jgi:hypothetical protein
MNMKAILLLIISGLTFSLWAQKKEFGVPPTDLRSGSLHSGDLFTVKMVPGDNETSFFVVGKKTGSFKIDKMKMEVVFSAGGEEKRMTLTRKDQAFIFPQKFEKDLRLELKGEKPGEIDKLNIKIKP